MPLIDECFSNNFIKRNKMFKVFMLSACWLRSSLRPRRRGTVRRCVLRAACSLLISSLSWFFLHSSGCYVKALLFPLFVAMVSSLWFPHFNFKETWKDHLDFFFFLSSSCWCLWLISLKLANNNIQLAPEQQGLQLRGSTHTWISSPYHSSIPSSIVWIPRCRTRDMEGQL